MHDLGDPAETHWFDDYDVYGQADATDLGDGELNRQGSTLALIRSYGAGAHLIWYAVSGDAATAKPPAVPAPLCKTGAQEGLAGPTWAPDGERLAFAAPDGIWTLRATADCGAAAPALLIPGASQPDWGPAPVEPGPRGNGSAAAAAVPAAAVSDRRADARGQARRREGDRPQGPRRRGRPARRRAPSRPSCSSTARRRASCGSRGRRGGHGHPHAGRGRARRQLALKPPAKLRKRFARLKRAKLTVRVTVTDAAGARQVLRRRV